MKEIEYVAQTIEKLNAFDHSKFVKYVPEGTGKGEPDIIGAIDGLGIVIEAKVRPNTPSKIQEARLNEWTNAGVLSLVLTYPDYLPFESATILYTMIQDNQHPKYHCDRLGYYPQAYYQSMFEKKYQVYYGKTLGAPTNSAPTDESKP